MKEQLKKELSLVDVFCIATGAMISSGLFILPGLAFAQAGPAVILSYVIAGIFCIPTLFSMCELTTAMPKAGGDYFYIIRGFGPLMGTVAGFSTWLSLSLKSAFALIGIGAYLSLYLNIPLNIIAATFCIFFIIFNLFGVGEAGKLQVFIVTGLLSILLLFVFAGSKSMNTANISPFFTKGFASIFSTASFVFVSYGGLMQVSALAEETKDPGRNLPLGMIFSLLATALLYASVIFISVGVLDSEKLSNTLTPISDAAYVFGGNILSIAVSIGALLAFISTANAGIMTASRYPFSMSRDELLPGIFQKVSSRSKIPYVSIIATGCFIIFSVLLLQLELLVKVASSVLLLLYIFANVSVILFRESKILSYRPKFISPLYPYIQIIGIIAGLFLLVEMGSFILFLTCSFLFLGIMWYKIYAQRRAVKDYALVYLLERLLARDKDLSSDSLVVELKNIVIQRDEVCEDRFHALVEKCRVLDIKEPLKMHDFFKGVASVLGDELGLSSDDLFNKFIDREKDTATVLRKGLAVPHIVIEGKNVFKLVLVRARTGIIFENDELVHIIFILAGSRDERNFHLKALAAIAQITQMPDFDGKWMSAKNSDELKNLVLLGERRRGC